jgi:predicted transcriptional regulator
MTVAEIARLVGGEIVCHKDLENKEIATACGSDMMSDVMAFYHDRGILLTGLVNVQVVRTASLLDIDAVCFVRGKKPTPEIMQLAQESDMPLITTTLPMFAACGILYNAGLKGNQATDGI